MGKNKHKYPKHPKVTLCTPTYNRRPFIPMMLKCFEHQTYPKDKIEWIIVDDGTDKIEDLVSHIPQIKYIRVDDRKLTLGQKRNMINDAATGDILINIDDDDYYPPERISHAVDMLKQNPKALCAGSSAMFIYFKHINKMYQFGPYGPNHATAATFAYKKELLTQTRFKEESSVAEEKAFLKDYTIPFVQLDPKKSILVFSHQHNSFDKKELLLGMPSPFIHDTPVVPSDIVKEPEVLRFFMQDIDSLLNSYEPGKPIYKADVTKQLAEIKEKREQMAREMHKKQMEYNNAVNSLMRMSPNAMQTPANEMTDMLHNKVNELTNIVNRLAAENQSLKETNAYLDGKIKQLIAEKILERKNQSFQPQLVKCETNEILSI
jgi:glycosyltransferase involved in cell wall biosynthesis